MPINQEGYVHAINSNEMFILALVAVSIVGLLCLGLLIVLSISILGQRREREQQKNPPNNDNSPLINHPPAAPQDEEKSNLTVSDWITFLSSEKHGLATTYFSFLALAVSLFSMFYVTSTSKSFWVPLIIFLFIVLVAYLIFIGAANRLQQRGQAAKEILDKIISRELIKEEDIRNEWLDRISKINNKKGWIRKIFK
jgi:ABC-type antimicrobial peptide transport system permease subunit